MFNFFPWLAQLFFRPITYLEQAFLHLTQPAHHSSVVLGAVADLTRTKSDLIAENAPLRQQLIVLYRQVNQPRFTQSDRLWFVLLASRVKHWKASLLIFKPDTLLSWHRQGFRLLWKFKSRNRGGRPKLATETISLIQAMAKENALWGAERIHGELLKLNIQVATTTIKKYLRQFRANHSPSQTWSVFLKNHAPNVWACDFLPVIDLFFRQVYLFFIVELGSRRVVHFNITAHPTDAWVAQQLREATPFDQHPRFLIRDRDRKYGQHFAAVTKGSQIEILKTPCRAPKANAICERFLGSVRRRVRVFGSHVDSGRKPFVSGHQGIRGILQPGSATSRDPAENTRGNSNRGERTSQGKNHRVSGAQWLTSRLPARGINKKTSTKPTRTKFLPSTTTEAHSASIGLDF